MNPKLWPTTMFLISRIGILGATVQCHEQEQSIGGMYLRGHMFKMYRVGLPVECYFRCEEEVTCQSYNVVVGQNICELNNRTKEARPEDFIPDEKRFYMKRSGNRGTLDVPSTSFLHLRFWAHFFLLFQSARLQKSQISAVIVSKQKLMTWKRLNSPIFSEKKKLRLLGGKSEARVKSLAKYGIRSSSIVFVHKNPQPITKRH